MKRARAIWKQSKSIIYVVRAPKGEKTGRNKYLNRQWPLISKFNENY